MIGANFLPNGTKFKIYQFNSQNVYFSINLKPLHTVLRDNHASPMYLQFVVLFAICLLYFIFFLRCKSSC